MTEMLRPSTAVMLSGRLRVRDGRLRLLRAGPGPLLHEHARRHRGDVPERRVAAAAGVRRDLVRVLFEGWGGDRIKVKKAKKEKSTHTWAPLFS